MVSNLRDRWDFVLRCKSCGEEICLARDSVDVMVGEPIASRLEGGGYDQAIFKRLAMLHVPEVCPSCRNMKAAGGGV